MNTVLLGQLMKLTFLIPVLLFVAGCLPNPSNRGAIKIGSEANVGIENSNFVPVDTSIKIDRVQIYNNQLYITGENLDRVKTLQVNGPGLDDRMIIESQQARQIIANASKQISFLISETFNLILNTANASATFQILFDFVDKSITAVKLNNMGANDGDVLRWNATQDTWEPADLNNLSYGGTWDATDGGILPGKIDFMNIINPPNGTYYVVNVAGSFNLGGITDWKVGDWAIYRDDCCWDQIVNSNEVTSVFGKKGVVTFGIDELDDVDSSSSAPAAADYTALVNDSGTWKSASVLSGADGSVITAKLADGSVTSAKLADGSVSNSKIQDNAITSNKIADGAIQTQDLAPGFGLNAGQVASGSCNVTNANYCALAGLSLGGSTLNSELQKYLKRDGSVPMIADLDLNGFSLLNVGGYSVAGNFQVQSTDTDISAGNAGGSDIGVIIQDDTSSSSFGVDTSGRMLRFQRTAAIGTDYVYDIGLDSAHEFTIFRRDSLDSAFKIDDSGNIGIGQADPQSLLHLKGNAGMVRLEGTDHTFIELYPDGPATRKGIFGFKLAGDDHITLENESVTNGNINLVPGPDGGVGVNTSSPLQLLHLKSSENRSALVIDNDNDDGDIYIHFKNSDTGPVVDTGWFMGLDEGDGNKFKIISSSGVWDPTIADLTIDVDGKMGLGIMNPESKLQIKAEPYTLITDGRSTLSLQPTNQFDDIGLSFRNSSGANVWSIFRDFTGDNTSTYIADLVFAGGDPENDPANLTERMRITQSGHLGLGTSTPVEPLHIYQSANTGTELLIDSPGAGSDQTSRLSLMTSGGDGTKAIDDAATKGWSMIARGEAYGTANEQNDFHIWFNNLGAWSNYFAIEHDTGNVGIGTRTPSAKLEVIGAIIATDIQTTSGAADFSEVNISNNVVTTNTTVGPDRNLILTSNGTGVVNPTKIDTSSGVTNVMTISHENSGGNGANGMGVSMDFSAEDDAGNNESIAMIEAVLTDASDGAEFGELNFKTTNSGTMTTAMSIKGTGDIALDSDTLYVDSVNNKVGVGTVSPTSANGESKLVIEGPVSSVNGPHMSFNIDSDNNPLLHILPYSHDNINLAFDSYWEVGGWRSSDAGSNFLLRKAGDNLEIMGSGGNTPGNLITFDSLFKVNTSGDVSLGGGTAEEKLDVQGNLVVGDNAAVGQLLLRTDNATNSVALRAPAGLGGNVALTLPSTPGGVGEILISDGTGVLSFTSNPAISNISDDDLDTSVNVEAAADEDKIRFTTVGSERMIIDETGKIGVGLSTPVVPFHIKPADNVTNTTGRGTLALQTTDQFDDIGLSFHNSGGAYVWSIFKEFSGDNVTTYTGDLVFAGGDSEATPDLLSEKMRIKSDGNIGVGTSTPAHKLHIFEASTANTELLLDITGAGTGQSSRLSFMTNGGDGAKQIADATTMGWTMLARSNAYSSANEQNDFHLWFNNNGVWSNYFALEHNTGNLGLGTMTPSEKLHVVGNSYVTGNMGVNVTAPGDRLHIVSSTNNQGITIQGTGLAGTGDVRLTLDGYRGTDQTEMGRIDFDVSTNDGARIASLSTATNSTTTGAHLSFSTSPNASSLTERMRILNTGQVGIGATNPTSLLHIYDSTNTDGLDVSPGLTIESGRAADSPVVMVLRNNAITPDDDPVFITMGVSDSGTEGAAGTTGEKGWKIGNIVNNTARFSIGYDEDDIDDLDTGVQENLIILPNGNIGISGGAAINSFTPTYTLQVQGNAGLSSGTSWTNVSDIRLKDIHGKFDKGLQEILSLEPIIYSYKKDNPMGLLSTHETIGFVAQEVERVIPEAVSENEKGYLQLNVDPIHWAHINATKEQQVEIEANKEMLKVMQGSWEELSRRVASLEEENQILKEENEKLKERLDRIEAMLNIKN